MKVENIDSSEGLRSIQLKRCWNCEIHVSLWEGELQWYYDETFFTEVDRLLAEAQIQRQDDTIKKDLIEKAIRLSKLGFRDMGYDRNDEYPDSDDFGSEFLSANPYSPLDDE